MALIWGSGGFIDNPQDRKKFSFKIFSIITGKDSKFIQKLPKNALPESVEDLFF